MNSPPFHHRHRGPIVAALLVTAALLLLLARPVRHGLRPATMVVIEFQHPAATSTARLRLVDEPGTVQVREVGGAGVYEPESGRIVIDVNGAPRNFNIDIPRATPFVELHVSDRTVFQRQGAAVTTIWPIGNDSTWLVPLTP